MKTKDKKISQLNFELKETKEKLDKKATEASCLAEQLKMQRDAREMLFQELDQSMAQQQSVAFLSANTNEEKKVDEIISSAPIAFSKADIPIEEACVGNMRASECSQNRSIMVNLMEQQIQTLEDDNKQLITRNFELEREVAEYKELADRMGKLTT